MAGSQDAPADAGGSGGSLSGGTPLSNPGGGIGGAGGARSITKGGGSMDADEAMNLFPDAGLDTPFRTSDLNRNTSAHQAALYAAVHEGVFGTPLGEEGFAGADSASLLSATGEMNTAPSEPAGSSTPSGDTRKGSIMARHGGSSNPFDGMGSM